MSKKLTKLQAYNAVTKLFQMYYDLDPSGDIGGILGSMAFLPDKTTADDAMLEIWTECLDEILKHKNLRNYNYITISQAFLAGGILLEGFYGTNDNSSEIKFLQENTKLLANKKTVDSILWKRWLKCVDEVLAVEDSRMYFHLSSK